MSTTCSQKRSAQRAMPPPSRIGRGVRAARIKMIKDDIARHLTDARLSVHTVAARHKVSPRYIQRLFDECGSTFTEHVIEQRLERAHRLLSDPRLHDRTLT